MLRRSRQTLEHIELLFFFFFFFFFLLLLLLFKKYRHFCLETKPLDESLSNFVCIPSGPLPFFWACQILGRGAQKVPIAMPKTLKCNFWAEGGLQSKNFIK